MVGEDVEEWEPTHYWCSSRVKADPPQTQQSHFWKVPLKAETSVLMRHLRTCVHTTVRLTEA